MLVRSLANLTKFSTLIIQNRMKLNMMKLPCRSLSDKSASTKSLFIMMGIPEDKIISGTFIIDKKSKNICYDENGKVLSIPESIFKKIHMREITPEDLARNAELLKEASISKSY